MLLNLGTTETPDWKPAIVGISSRTNAVSEETQDYYYMSGKGSAETEPTTQKVSVTFTGHRAVGDPLQDKVMDDMLFDMEIRNLEFIDYQDIIDAPGASNGWKGDASITITDFGSGEANVRQTISFTMNLKGKPERGSVAYDNITKKYTWTPK